MLRRPRSAPSADYGRTLGISGDANANGGTLGTAQHTIVRGHTDSHQRCASADQAQSSVALSQRSEATPMCSRLGSHESVAGRDLVADVRWQESSDQVTSVDDTGVAVENTATGCVPFE